MSGREHGHDQAMPHSGQATATTPRPSDELEVVPGFERENLQGWIPQLATEADIRAVIEKAFDYRGDVTITQKSGAEITGYLFDRRIGPSLENSVVRLILATSTERPSIPYSKSRPSLQRPRHRRRQELRSLGQEILGKARRGREEYFD